VRNNPHNIKDKVIIITLIASIAKYTPIADKTKDAPKAKRDLTIIINVPRYYNNS
jgi:hypothetical protein